MTKNEFLNRVENIHKNKYSYINLFDKLTYRDEILIKCNEHGIFKQKVGSHLNGQGCKKCFSKKESLGLNNFIYRSNIIHNNKYNYSLVNYINNKIPVTIICPEHGQFNQRPDSHLKGNGCPKCANELKRNKFKKDNIIELFKIVHKNKYDYSLTNYVNNKTKIKIICPIHGIFEQNPYNHLKGFGCNICNISSGEKKIMELLDALNIKYIRQKTFPDCKMHKKLYFDFYLPEKNICIEYDGPQHFIPIEHWGGEKGLYEQKKRDEFKNNYCAKNNIKLIRIKFDEDIDKKINLIYD